MAVFHLPSARRAFTDGKLQHRKPSPGFSFSTRLWIFWRAASSRATPLLSLMTSLPTWTSLPRRNFCLFSSFEYQKPQRWNSFKRPFSRVPAWLTLASTAHHTQWSLHTSVDGSDIWSMSSNSDVSRYCPTLSLFSFIASRLHDFILCNTSMGNEENDGFLTPTSLLSFTWGHLKWNWWCSQLLTMQHVWLEDCPWSKRSSHQPMLLQMPVLLSYHFAPSWRE